MNDKLAQLIKMGKTLNVLYVEDNDQVRDSTLGMLNRFFGKVDVGIDGEDGLDQYYKAGADAYDMILTDINMPKLNGIEMIKKIRETDKETTILVLSAHNESHFFTETIRLGVEGYLLKPVDLPQFLDMLTNAVEKITLKRENDLYRQGLENMIALRTEELEHRLYHDDLTNLKNRISLVHDLETQTFSSVLLIDIDRFHVVNELFGQDGGNEVLTQFANFLRTFSICRNYEVYRLNGDSFVLRSKKDYLNLEEYEKEIPELLEMLSNFSVYLPEADDYVEIDITVGISFEKQNALEKAEIALKFAQENRRNFIAYNRSIDTTKQLKDARFWRSEIKQAINEGRILPLFQPIYDRAQKVVKYEVLMRLEREKEGKMELVSPFFFLNVAKQTKQYEKLTEIMINKSFEIMRDLDVNFSVNLSFEDINNRVIVQMLMAKIVEYNVGDRLIFEIVESEKLENYEAVAHFVKDVKELGVRIAIDDFGSGFSNYKRIFEIGPSFLKIDGSLIKNVNKDKNSYELVKSIASLTKALNIKTIGEYICSREIFEVCYEIGVEEFQGYYFSEPITIEEVRVSMAKEVAIA